MGNNVEISMEMYQLAELEGIYLEEPDRIFYSPFPESHYERTPLYVGGTVVTRMQTTSMYSGTLQVSKTTGRRYTTPYKTFSKT